jgi:hypothetical protein
MTSKLEFPTKGALIATMAVAAAVAVLVLAAVAVAVAAAAAVARTAPSTLLRCGLTTPSTHTKSRCVASSSAPRAAAL